MSTYADADLPLIVPGTAGTVAEAHALLAEARTTTPLARGVFGPLVLRHEQVSELVRDPRLRGPGLDLARMSGISEGSRTWARLEQILLFMEGDGHHRLRRLVAKAFTPRSVEILRPATRATIATLVDAVIDDGRCDAVPSLCDPYPVPVICSLVGVEADRWQDMSRWATATLLSLRFDAGQHVTAIEQAQSEMDEFVTALIADRRRSPRDDLLSHLVAVEEEGDRLTQSELLSVVSMMLVAGTDTTRLQLGNMLHTFATHPDQWQLVRDRPDLVPAAVEEAIRWAPATEALPRVALEDIEISGITVPAGSIVVLLSMSANHDVTALPGADTFDVTRANPAGWHLLTFGGGVHYCLGANLARLELTEALAELSARLPDLRLDGEAVPSPVGSPLFGYTSLPIAWS